MAVIKISDKVAKAVADRLEKMNKDANMHMSENGNSYPLYYGYMNGSINRLIDEIRRTGILFESEKP